MDLVTMVTCDDLALLLVTWKIVFNWFIGIRGPLWDTWNEGNCLMSLSIRSNKTGSLMMDTFFLEFFFFFFSILDEQVM